MVDRWFKPAPSEIQELMDGFSALKEALSKDPTSLAASIAAERDRVHQMVANIEASQASVSAAYSSMVNITKNLEEQGSLNEQRLYQYSSRAQELHAQIEKLTSQLKEAKDSYAQEVLMKEEITRCLDHHNERVAKLASLQSKLDDSSTQNRSQLQDFEEAIAHFTTQDEEGLTKHVRSLLDFFKSCSSES
jgi:chromosome segregation ATPase